MALRSGIGTAQSPSSPPPDNAVPAELKRFIAQHQPERYRHSDHGVWRFVLSHLIHQLDAIAHPAFATGLARLGMHPGSIVAIDELSRRLTPFGFRAVCVDGFLPPRVFQNMQSLGLLPIAGEIRAPAQLTYTPAPDIIHEAIGHAPILTEESYAAFIQRIGRVSARAFASLADAQVDAAVRALSCLEEQPRPDPQALELARLAVSEAQAAALPASEATRLARLFWWTAEYGLIGSPRDFRLYGAGLLSSLGEGHFCRGPRVQKLELDIGCCDVGYDITRPQPQLYVARDFAHLHEVLEQVESQLAHTQGGAIALAAASESAELAQLFLTGEDCIVAVVRPVEGVPLRSAAWLARGATRMGAQGPQRFSGESLLVLGPLRRRSQGPHLELQLSSGLRVTGRLAPGAGPSGTMATSTAWLTDIEVTYDGVIQGRYPGPYNVISSAEVRTVAPATAYPESATAAHEMRLVPSSRPLEHPVVERALGDLSTETYADLESIHATLQAELPNDWLSRWGLLKELANRKDTSSLLSTALRGELETLEAQTGGREPIRMALKALDSQLGGRT